MCRLRCACTQTRRRGQVWVHTAQAPARWEVSASSIHHGAHLRAPARLARPPCAHPTIRTAVSQSQTAHCQALHSRALGQSCQRQTHQDPLPTCLAAKETTAVTCARSTTAGALGQDTTATCLRHTLVPTTITWAAQRWVRQLQVARTPRTPITATTSPLAAIITTTSSSCQWRRRYITGPRVCACS